MCVLCSQNGAFPLPRVFYESPDEYLKIFYESDEYLMATKCKCVQYTHCICRLKCIYLAACAVFCKFDTLGGLGWGVHCCAKHIRSYCNGYCCACISGAYLVEVTLADASISGLW